MAFKIGDRVMATRDIPGNTFIHAGYGGTVCDSGAHIGRMVGVAWDSPICGHDCNGRCIYGHGYYVCLHDIELVDDEAELVEVDESAILSLLSV